MSLFGSLFGKKKEAARAPAADAPRALVAAGPTFLRRMAADALAEAGWDVAQSPLVAAAAELVPLHRPEVVVYFAVRSMPEDNAQLKAAAASARVLLVGPTQVSAEDLAALADECGAASFVGVPFTSSELVEAATRCRTRSESEAAAWRASLAAQK